MTAFSSHTCKVAVSIRVPPAEHSTIKAAQFKEVWEEYKEITSNYDIAPQGRKEQSKGTVGRIKRKEKYGHTSWEEP